MSLRCLRQTDTHFRLNGSLCEHLLPSYYTSSDVTHLHLSSSATAVRIQAAARAFFKHDDAHTTSGIVCPTDKLTPSRRTSSFRRFERSYFLHPQR